MSQLPGLIAVFAYLSLLTVGGGMAAFPEMKSLVVDTHHWMTFPQLIHLYSIGQMAPGPNMMMIAGIGQWVAGPVGALVVVIAFFLPTGLFTLWVGRLWKRLDHWPWRAAIQRGLAPVSIGLLLAGAISISKGALIGWASIAIAAAMFATLVTTRINPIPLILVAAIAGYLAF
ncbi:chromate transporter [Aquabacter spiritensis]|uniref:Chromate transporter n=1 Tax=Aquabacter spiritensis TaxID=933073 RepID=A0A4R3LUQ1_9HYPH|nr:chromate transporter [Aquabacter spiritensis]TCT04251.1 chromate transporter [Aquabacter spiritensis]